MAGIGIACFDGFDEADFTAEILGSDSIEVLVDSLRAISPNDWEFVGHTDGMRALLGAEIIADQMGHETGDLSGDLHSWIHGFGDAEPENVELARVAVKRIIRCSETKEFYRDSEKFEDWLTKTDRLAEHLQW
jgi:hypothetical protein